MLFQEKIAESIWKLIKMHRVVEVTTFRLENSTAYDPGTGPFLSMNGFVCVLIALERTAIAGPSSHTPGISNSMHG